MVDLNPKPSKQTMFLHLKELKDEHKIYKKEVKYFPSDPDLSFIIHFGKIMRQASGLVLSPDLLLQRRNDQLLAQFETYPDSQVFTGSTSEELLKLAKNPTLSPKVGIDYKNIDSLQKEYLFQFAIRIGAFITYIFLESMRRPTNNLKIKIKNQGLEQKNKTLKKILQYSIDLESYFKVFERYMGLLNQTGGISQLDLESAFKDLFPSFYEGLEKFYRNEIFDHTNSLEMHERYSKPKFYCPHKWQEFHIFKIDTKYYYCSRCRHVVDEYRKKESDERQMRRNRL